MRRLAGVGLFLIFMLSLGLSGCGGGNTSAVVITKPTTVTLSPSSISLERGAVIQVTVLAKDKDGKPLLNQTPTFASSNTAAVTVSTGGLVCAGTWDSLTTPIVCTPAAAAATSNLTATAGGVASNVVLVSVHEHVNTIVVCRQGDPDPCPLLAPPVVVDCRSGTQVTGVTPVNQTEQLKASAYAGGVDITSTVGTFSWLVTDATIATATTLGPSTSPLLAANQAIFTAKNPGQTSIAATLSGTNSVPAAFITCSPATISIDVPTPTLPDTSSSFSIATSATKQLESKVIDTMGVTITGLTLTWSTSQPAIASVTSAGLVTGAAPGASVITASCAPTTCNVGLNQTLFSNNVYSNPVTATITGTATTTTVYATTSDPVLALGGHRDLIPISTSTNTAGTAIALPTDAAINSLIINSAGTTAYLGSSKGLVVVNASTNAVSSTVTNVLGTALGVSPSGQFVVTSDTGAGKVYVYDSVNNTVSSFNIAGATHVSFTPDSLKTYIVAGTNLYQYSPLFSLRTIPMNAPANDVAVNSTGQFAYTAGGDASAVAARSTCRNDSNWAPEDSVATGATPDLIASAATGDLLAVEGGSSEIDKITPTIDPPAPLTSCPPTLTSNTLTTANFGVGAFTPRQIIVTSDGSKAYVTNNQASILVFNVGVATTDVIPLAGGGTQSFTGGATLDGKNLYVGVGGVNAVHRIDTTVAPATADVQQISVSFVPDLVAVRPH